MFPKCICPRKKKVQSYTFFPQNDCFISPWVLAVWMQTEECFLQGPETSLPSACWPLKAHSLGSEPGRNLGRNLSDVLPSLEYGSESTSSSGLMPQIHSVIAFSLRVLWRGLALPSCGQPGKNPGGPRNMFSIDIRRKPTFSLPLAHFLFHVFIIYAF